MKPLIIFGHPNNNTFNGDILSTVEDFFANKGVKYKVSNLYEMNFNPVLSLEEYQNRSKATSPSDIMAEKEKNFIYYVPTECPFPSDVMTEQEKVTWADTLIFIYPVWWNREPAIVKGWIDRVLAQNFAFEETNGDIHGLLSGKRALVICTFAASQDAVEKSGILEAMHTCMSQATLEFCGIEPVTNQEFFEIPETGGEQRDKMLQKVTQLLENL